MAAVEARLRLEHGKHTMSIGPDNPIPKHVNNLIPKYINEEAFTLPKKRRRKNKTKTAVLVSKIKKQFTVKRHMNLPHIGID